MQTRFQIGALQGRNHFLEVAFHHAVEIVKRERNAVIGDPILRRL